MKRPIALLLVCLMLLCCGCTGGGDGVTVEEPTPTPMPHVPTEVEAVLDKAPSDAELVDVAVTIHGAEEIIHMTPVSGGFAHRGGPKFSLLVDKSRYQVNDVGDFAYVTLPTGMSGDVYVELGFRPDTKSKDIGTEILDEYGIMGVKVPAENAWLGNNRVRHLHGETVQNVFDVYLLDTEGGCMTVVLSTSPYTTAHRARLAATLESLEIFE